MRPKSAFVGLAAGLRSQAAARRIPFGLINQFKMAAKGFVHRTISGMARASWMKSSLTFFAAGLWCLPLRGAADTNTYEFEKSLPKPGSIQWDINHRITKEHQGALPEACANPRCRWRKCSKGHHCEFGQWQENSDGPNTIFSRHIRNAL